MTDPITQLKSCRFECPEAIEIATYIQEVLDITPPAPEHDNLVGFTVGAPFFAEAMWKAATDKNQQSLIQPVLTNIKEYFLENDDLIPDHHGIVGLLDDTYLVYCYIDQLNTHWAETNGGPFVDIHFNYEMQLMAHYLKKDIAEKIESHVRSVIDGDTTAIDFKTAGKFLAVGLAGIWAVNKIANTGTSDNSEEWVELLNNRVDHGW